MTSINKIGDKLLGSVLTTLRYNIIAFGLDDGIGVTEKWLTNVFKEFKMTEADAKDLVGLLIEAYFRPENIIN